MQIDEFAAKIGLKGPALLDAIESRENLRWEFLPSEAHPDEVNDSVCLLEWHPLPRADVARVTPIQFRFMVLSRIDGWLESTTSGRAILFDGEVTTSHEEEFGVFCEVLKIMSVGHRNVAATQQGLANMLTVDGSSSNVLVTTA